jgi:hypothetical protein
MKKYLKTLLVAAVLAFVPSLTTNTFAQDPGGGTGGDDPVIIPVKGTPSPNPGTGPRFMPDDYDDIPIVPWPGGDIPHPRNSPDDHYDDAPITPKPQPNPGHDPRSIDPAPHCYHSSGVIYIDADAAVTSITATVNRTDENLTWSGTSATNTLSITVSPDPGEYYLDLTLSDGRSYIGKYIIE